MWWMLLMLLACGERPGDDAGVVAPAGPAPELAAAHETLRTALAGDDLDAISAAARAASAFQGQDRTLDRDLGDALSNRLLHPEAGAVLLRSSADPADEQWLRAARDAALRLGDRTWLSELVAAPEPDADDWSGLSLDHPVVDQVIVAARTDATVDTALLHEVLADCTLVDARPMLGRRQVDLPAPTALRPVLELFGATRVVIARTQLTQRGAGLGATTWQCERGWLSDRLGDDLPDPLPPKGALVAATDGRDSAWLELENTRSGPWASVASDAEAAARWVQAATLLDERLAAGDAPADARARVLARFGPGLLPSGARGTE